MRIRIVDAFTDRPFAGNPAGVVLLDSPAFPGDRWLQQVAAEVNLSETAFAHPLPADGTAGADDWALRWFTPVAEVALCGHATLATAHVLHTTRGVTGTVRFATRSGTLAARTGADGAFTLDFPTAPLTPAPVAEDLAAALGARPLGVHGTGEQVSDLLVDFADEETVRTLAPDLPGLVKHSQRGIIVTAPAAGASGGYDFVARCFYPRMGVDEDPVTGSAYTALAPFWSARLGRPVLRGLQASARTGLVRTELRGARTLLTGRAVTVIDGELLA